MWGRLLIAGAALVSFPAAAEACQCDGIEDLSAAEREERAQYYAGLGLSIAEVERTDDNRGGPERYRVINWLHGPNPQREISIYPSLTRLPDGTFIGTPTSCDYSGTPGARKVVAFSTRTSANSSGPCGVLASINDSGLRLYGQCLQYLLDDAAFVRRLIALSRAQAGVSRSSRPLSSSR